MTDVATVWDFTTLSRDKELFPHFGEASTAGEAAQVERLFLLEIGKDNQTIETSD